MSTIAEAEPAPAAMRSGNPEPARAKVRARIAAVERRLLEETTK